MYDTTAIALVISGWVVPQTPCEALRKRDTLKIG